MRRKEREGRGRRKVRMEQGSNGKDEPTMREESKLFPNADGGKRAKKDRKLTGERIHEFLNTMTVGNCNRKRRRLKMCGITTADAA